MPDPKKKSGCAGSKCTLTEVEIYDLTDFYTYERNFHLGPVWVRGMSESGKAELRRQARELSAWIEDCPDGCICDFDRDQHDSEMECAENDRHIRLRRKRIRLLLSCQEANSPISRALQGLDTTEDSNQGRGNGLVERLKVRVGRLAAILSRIWSSGKQ